MDVQQVQWRAAHGWSDVAPLKGAGLVLAFGGRDRLEAGAWREGLAELYPGADLVACSTAGEIMGTGVEEDSIVATAIRFQRVRHALACVNVREHADSSAAGEALARALGGPDLAHVLVFSDGQLVNGSALVDGLRRALPSKVAVTGGLAGDGARFQRTFVSDGGEAREGNIVGIGLYGDLRVGYGSLGGWDPFGPERIVTRSEGASVLEFDGEPALALYKRYLGEHAAGLPATGLLFPLSVRTKEGHQYVRTILNVDENGQKLLFAGDVPQGSYARLMKANFDRLVDGAHGAASTSQAALAGSNAELAILISCVGRKLVLQQRTDEEIEAVRSVLGPGPVFAGFYSYGEICPSAPNASCQLHNQTMTITTLSEA